MWNIKVLVGKGAAVDGAPACAIAGREVAALRNQGQQQRIKKVNNRKKCAGSGA